MKYPDYIWDVETRHLICEKTGKLFLDCECNIAQFNDIEQVHKYLKENNIKGVVGRKVN